MEVSNAEAAACIKALKWASRYARLQSDPEAARDFAELRAALFDRYFAEVGGAPLSTDDADALGLDPGGRFSDEPEVAP